MSDLEHQGLSNIVFGSLHPEAIHLAVAGCLIDPEPQAALDALATALLSNPSPRKNP